MTSDADVKEISPAPTDLTAGMMSEVRGGRGLGRQLVGSHGGQKKQSCKIKLSFKFTSNKCLFSTSAAATLKLRSSVKALIDQSRTPQTPPKPPPLRACVCVCANVRTRALPAPPRAAGCSLLLGTPAEGNSSSSFLSHQFRFFPGSGSGSGSVRTVAQHPASTSDVTFIKFN